MCCIFVLSMEQAYVQQLESSRLKLTQLEQDLQRARSQVLNLIYYIIYYVLYHVMLYYVVLYIIYVMLYYVVFFFFVFFY